MEIDQSESESQSQSSKQKVEALTGHLSSSLAKLSGSSRGIPSDKDFYFYNNFDEFKLPIKQISDKSNLMLGAIGSGAHVWGKEMSFPVDFDDAYDWMVNVNDEVFERFDVSIDEFQGLRKKEEEGGFQLVYGKNKKKDRGEGSSVKVASRDKKTTGTKPKVPFHIPTIPRPQDEYRIVVNNTNQPFQHVWLQRSEDGSRLIHPQEKFSASDFVDNNIGDVETVKPLPIESTPFKLVEEVKDLKELAAKLRYVNEFAVDLEHNHYRSFQGLTCLMQISTRTEDFIVDTLKLRVHIGPYLRDVFKDPMKKKVMHGADSDILWLQRDFGIYVCNLFDTGQASRVLKMERNSLEYLLYHFCGVTANKEYQQADWRLRPIPDEMLKYAREDTHYLLHMYDLLRIRLLSTSSESEEPDDLLIEVYKRSYDLCMQLYEKELLTESSYLYIYGLRGANLNARQLAIVQGLSEWRDGVARAEDESTGYVLPNKTLLEIAKQVPVTASQLRHVMNSKHPYVERNLGSVVSIIRLSLQNAPAFAAVVEQLKEGSIGRASGENIVAVDENEALDPEAPASTKLKDSIKLESNGAEICRNQRRGASKYVNQDGNNRSETDHIVTNLQRGNSISSGQSAGVTVQVLKKPSRAFGAMLGNSTAKRKLDSVKIDKGEFKLEQIKSSVNFPFHSFVGSAEQLPQHAKEKPKISEIVHQVESPAAQTASCVLEDILLLEGDANHIETGILEVKDEHSDYKGNRTLESASEIDEGDEPMSLSDLSSSFKKCLQPTQNGAPNQFEKLKASSGFLQLKPFDYEAARTQFRLGEDPVVRKGEVGDGGHRTRLDRRKSSALVQSQKDEGNKEFAQGRRRQAFPASGNRSATFR